MLLIVVALAGCGTPKPPSPAAGAILSSRPLPGAPAGATGTRIVYASTAPDGASIAVSGLVIVPAAQAPAGGRLIVAWMHPTTGIAQDCAPSTGPNPFGQIQGLNRFLSAGYVVVATDYPGLGTADQTPSGTPPNETPALAVPPVHPYLVGASEARAALDSVRAAGNLPNVSASKRFAVWGHSQGGHAALFVASLAPSYAPELQLVGVAAAAPVTDIAALIEQPAQDPLWGGLLSYTVSSWSQLFGLDTAGIVPAEAAPAITQAAKDCLQNGVQLNRLEEDAAPLSDQPVTPTGQWQTMLSQNDPQPWQSGVPVFLAQGEKDPIIDPSLTREFARRLCAQGVPVRYRSMRGVDHYTAGVRSANAVADWIAKRFASEPPPDDCRKL